MNQLLPLTGLLVLLPVASLEAENWPCFRGPSRQGISTETGLPLKWNATEGVAWKTEIPGESWSSPITWEKRVFVTTATSEGKSCRVLALSLDSGMILWGTEVFTQQPGHKQARNTYATPTPATDGERVYAAFGDGSFAAVDMKGQKVWENREYPFYSEHGLGASPVLWEDLLIMSRDGSSETEPKSLGWQQPWDKGFVVALNTRTGKTVWKTGRGSSRIAHVSPNIWISPSGRTQVIAGAGDVVQGFDARAGSLLWTSRNIGEGVVPSIVLGDELAFTASGWGGRESIKAFRLGDSGDLVEKNLAWEQKKAMPRVPSFLYLKPYLYTVTDNGMAACLKGESGEIVWQERVGGNYSASPVGAEDRIYLTSDSGETTVLRAGQKFEVIAKNPLGESVQASMAISGGKLLLRGARNLYCIGSR